MDKFYFRKAQLSDVEVLEDLIKLSSEKINSKFYTKEEVEASIGLIWTVDTQLIKDQTYWVCENNDGMIIACAGWSKRKVLFGKKVDNELEYHVLTPGKDPAKIRAFFVHPDYIRRGIGRNLLNICETEALDAGFTSFELRATLSGEKFYAKCGYIALQEHKIDLGNNLKQKTISMYKNSK